MCADNGAHTTSMGANSRRAPRVSSSFTCPRLEDSHRPCGKNRQLGWLIVLEAAQKPAWSQEEGLLEPTHTHTWVLAPM